MALRELADAGTYQLDVAAATIKSLLCPPALHPGDRVALVAPAGPSLLTRIEAAVQLLEAWDLKVELGANVRATHRRAAYLAGSDEQRASDLQDAWLDPEVRAVICLRGGYGSMRVIEHLDFKALAVAEPKLLVGSSDITALHQAWAAHLGIATLFTPMPATPDVLDDPGASAKLRAALFDFGKAQNLTGARAEEMVAGAAAGVLVGGNVSLIAASVGTPEWRLPVGAIGLLEEVHEEPYRLDLLLLQLKRSGWLDALSGLALGSWEDCGDPSEVKELLREYVMPLGIPVVWQLGFGHCQDALSIPLGLEAALTTNPPRVSLTDQLHGRQI